MNSDEYEILAVRNELRMRIESTMIKLDQYSQILSRCVIEVVTVR
jgi:hypothetical protein